MNLGRKTGNKTELRTKNQSPRGKEILNLNLSMSFKSVDRDKTVQAILQKASKNTDTHYHPSFT
jgi:hypothetical protein